MKKKIIFTTTLIIISSLIILLSYKKEDNITFLGEVNNKSNLLSIMLETSSGSGNYQESSSNSFPTNGYIFNENLSGCENGSKISWDEENNRVSVESNKTDKCYIYFDMYTPTLAETITKLYTGVQGKNGLYYHDSSLTNGANDNSYRYAGASDSVNNYVCFGSDEATCPTDNLYRIIGVFNNQIKLIKYDYANSNLLGTDGDYASFLTYDKSSNSTYKGTLETINTYLWNYNSDTYAYNTWSTSLLNKTNLNTNYLNNIGSKWSEMIDTTIWKVGGNSQTLIFYAIPTIAYQNEILNPVTTKTMDNKTEYSAKIGLMYASDYGFAASSSNWTKALNEYSASINENWLYMGLYEWTITRSSDDANLIYSIHYGGSLGGNTNGISYAIRPTFYLNSSVVKTSGDGTKTNPYRIS